ncbi:isochorismatase family protein [Kitasatospora atroaurantiaca]|uniref:isochorismatase family protein n=1 Tax=Kitasatospora atroaurantiaca TaxID=285545 RepID=UPI00119E5F17|nr:isochorismatase family protein [Kitasatospora atroaurantiaca]
MTALDPQRTALVLIDLQTRIAALPLTPRTGAEVVEVSRSLAQAYRKAGATVAVVQVHRPDVDEQPPGSELVDDLLDSTDLLVTKRTFGGFHDGTLHAQLKQRGITTLVLAGITTNLGVESTARAARDHGYRLLFAGDAMAALTPEEHDLSVSHNFPHFGEVVTAAEAVARINAAQPA